METNQSRDEAPEILLSVADAIASGALPPIDASKLRMELAMAERTNPRDCRRAIAFLLQRVRAYYQVLGYCGPCITRMGGEFPDAMHKVPQYDRLQGLWYRPCVSITRPDTGPVVAMETAGLLCLDTALKIAAHEATVCCAEAGNVVDLCRRAARTVVVTYAGVRWDAMRCRMGTPGIRKVLDVAVGRLRHCHIGIETGPAAGLFPVVDATEAGMAYRNRVVGIACGPIWWDKGAGLSHDR